MIVSTTTLPEAAITHDQLQWESERGRLVAYGDERTTTLRWFQNRFRKDGTGHEMMRFDRETRILTIFPMVELLGVFKPQFDQVRELQLDLGTDHWNAEDSVGENSYFAGELEVEGLPQGFGSIFAFGLGLRRRYRGIVEAIESTTDCDIVRFGADEEEGIKGRSFFLGMTRFARYRSEVDRNRDRGSAVVRRVNEAESVNTIAELLGRDLVSPTLGGIR
jgi:hypothetical protein